MLNCKMLSAQHDMYVVEPIIAISYQESCKKTQTLFVDWLFQVVFRLFING